MEEKAAERFLNALSAIVRNGRDNIPESRLSFRGSILPASGLAVTTPVSHCQNPNTGTLFIETALRCSAARRRVE